MASDLTRCLMELVMRGDVSAETARQARALMEQLERDLRAELGPDAAKTAAQREALRRMEMEALRRKRLKLLTIRTRARIMNELEQARQRGGMSEMLRAAEAHFDSAGLEDMGIRGVEQERKAIMGLAHGRMSELLAAFHTDIAGRTRNKAQLLNVVREAFGESTGDQAAKELAEAWLGTAEWLRQAFNRAGGDIGKLERWGLPQAHDGAAIHAAGFERWRDFVVKRLDRSRMISRDAGAPMTDIELEQALRDTYEAILSDGWVERKPSGQAQGRALANRHADHRFLHFRDAAAWLEYQERFGRGDPWATMMGYIERMSRDIAALRILGPNPNSTVEWLRQVLEREKNLLPARTDMDERELKRWNDRISRSQTVAERMWEVYSGAAHVPASDWMARAAGTARSMLVSAQLGSAMLSAISDTSLTAITSRFLGLGYGRVLKRQMGLLFKPGDGGRMTRAQAIRAGLIAEEWGRVAAGHFRWTMEEHSAEVASRLASGVLRASGLSAWTQAGRHAFQLEFLGLLADMAGRDFKALPEKLRTALKRYRIGAREWDIIRTTEIWGRKAGGIIRPDDVRARTDIDAAAAEEAAFRLLHMIQSEAEYAVPTTTLRTQAALHAGAKAGTVWGELVKSAGMYRSFAITMLVTHWRRAARLGGWHAARYAGALVIGATVMGAVALQLKQMARGRDPEPMDNTAFWLRSLLQGGGLGIFGDFLLDPGQNRFGHTLGETVAGPLIGFGSDLQRLTIGNIGEAISGEETHAARELVRFAGRYAPGASLWYLRLALEREVLDQMMIMVDPDAEERFRRHMRMLAREKGQQYWAPPGEHLTSDAVRFPDVANVFGER